MYTRSTINEDQHQFTLGEVISEIEKAGIIHHGGDSKFKNVSYDFGTAIPTTLDSYRGHYNELALGYKMTGYDNDKERHGHINADDLLKELKSGIGKVFTGWKGGDYRMNEDTPVWVANPGDSGSTVIVGVFDEGWQLVLLTAYCEY